jgi:hypothetical protein
MEKTFAQKELRKNRKSQRHLFGKDDPESMKKLERLMVEEKEMIKNMETDIQRREKRLRIHQEKGLLKSMTFEETLDYYKNLDKGSAKMEEHRIPNTREARIHRKKVIQGIQEYKMNQYFIEQIEMRRKLKEYLESIENEY